VARYFGRRLLVAIPTLLALSFLIFTLVSSAPGDPAEELVRRRAASQDPTPEAIRDARAELHLDRPFLTQYGLWLKGAVTADLGPSFSKKRPVVDEIRDRIGATVELAFAAVLLVVVMALPLGILAAMFHRHWADQALRVWALLGASIPGFFFGYLLIIEFATRLKLLPVAGREEGHANPVGAGGWEGERAHPPEEGVGNLDEDARAIARLGIASTRPAMAEIDQRLDALGDDRMAALAGDAGHEGHAAAVVLEPRVVERREGARR